MSLPGPLGPLPSPQLLLLVPGHSSQIGPSRPGSRQQPPQSPASRASRSPRPPKVMISFKYPQAKIARTCNTSLWVAPRVANLPKGLKLGAPAGTGKEGGQPSQLRYHACFSRTAKASQYACLYMSVCEWFLLRIYIYIYIMHMSPDMYELTWRTCSRTPLTCELAWTGSVLLVFSYQKAAAQPW